LKDIEHLMGLPTLILPLDRQRIFVFPNDQSHRESLSRAQKNTHLAVPKMGAEPFGNPAVLNRGPVVLRHQITLVLPLRSQFVVLARLVGLLIAVIQLTGYLHRKEAQARQILPASSTMCYGIFDANPNLLILRNNIFKEGILGVMNSLLIRLVALNMPSNSKDLLTWHSLNGDIAE